MDTMNQITRDTMKEETMKDLEEVYRKASAMNLLPAEHSEVNKLIFSTFQAGIDRALSADQLEGYSNLTAAIKDNEPIDWERLDGLNVKCVNPGLRGELHGTLERDPNCSIERAVGWWNGDVDRVYTSALRYAWDGDNGWTLYVEGDIPMRRKTADELKLGTYFLGQLKGESPYLAYVGRPLATDTEKTIYYAPEMLKAIATATDWVVLEEYGTFQKPEGK